MTTQIGIHLSAAGAAIVSVGHDADGDMIVLDIERLPFSFNPIADRVAALDEFEPRDTRFVVDAEGLGQALWATLPAKVPYMALGGAPRPDPRRWTLYTAKGLERQALVDILVVAVRFETLHFEAGLAEMGAMTAALVGYRRQVREDGLIGGELVVALCLAMLPPPRKLGGHAFTA